jgi:hypothetical protein
MDFLIQIINTYFKINSSNLKRFFSGFVLNFLKCLLIYSQNYNQNNNNNVIKQKICEVLRCVNSPKFMVNIYFKIFYRIK